MNFPRMNTNEIEMLHEIDGGLGEVMDCIRVAASYKSTKDEALIAAKRGEQWLLEAQARIKSLTGCTES